MREGGERETEREDARYVVEQTSERVSVRERATCRGA